ncbi:hypothetical protein [Pseudomonas sp. RL]|uniref:hypothetical protein n=1 Tax=Pseudomonas sp. RL TaxID=1452718 RepID=UPI0004819F42|nr:hypothetical protein [Pseudomonas sp. RL]
MSNLFSGPYFEHVRAKEPLRSADYFTHGSSAMLFQRDGQLYRLTTDGCGHCFLSEQSAKGNPHVVKVIQDFGPVAPADDGYQDEFYWLAQVEWLQPVDATTTEGARLAELFTKLTDGELVEREDRALFLERCRQAALTQLEFAPLLTTLILAAQYLPEDDGAVDCNITNVMRRPSTGMVVWSDPIHFSVGYLTESQQSQMNTIREHIAQAQAVSTSG